MANLFKKAYNFLTKPQDYNDFNEAFLAYINGGTASYDPLGKTYIEQGYNCNPFVYAFINQMATKTANIPYAVKKIKDTKSYNKLKILRKAHGEAPTTQQALKQAILSNKAFTDNEFEMPLEAPNALQSWSEFFALWKTFIKTTGNTYIYMLSPKEGMNAGTPIQVYLLPPHLMEIVVKKNASMLGAESPVDYYMLIQGKSYIEFAADDVIHIKYPNPNYDEQGSHLYGMSPLRAVLKNIESTNTALELNIKTLKSGGAFGFIHGKSQALNEPQAKEIKQRLREMNASPEDLSKIAGISAEIGFTRLSLTSDELKPFDYLGFDKQAIADVLIWSIDDGGRGDFGGTINEIKKTRITDNIMPDLRILSEALNKYFLPRFKGYEDSCIEWDASELEEMQQDTKSLVDWLTIALNDGTITRNEYRLALSYEKSDVDNMDAYTVKGEIMTLEDALDMELPKNE
mgnify:CR=1 FL=1